MVPAIEIDYSLTSDARTMYMVTKPKIDDRIKPCSATLSRIWELPFRAAWEWPPVETLNQPAKLAICLSWFTRFFARYCQCTDVNLIATFWICGCDFADFLNQPRAAAAINQACKTCAVATEKSYA